MSNLPGDKSGRSAEEGVIALPWRAACLAFEYHILNKALQKGMALSDVMDLLDRSIKGEVVEEVRVILDDLITETEGKAILRATCGDRSRGFAVEIPKLGWNRSEPTKEGGLMVGPGSPFYGSRILGRPRISLLDFPPEMIEQMQSEIALSWAGGPKPHADPAPLIKGVIAGDGIYKPAVVDQLTHEEVVQLGLVYDIYPAGHVPDDERENLHDWMVKNNGSLGWHASAQTKENIEAMRKGEVHIRDLPGAYLSLTVATNAPFWGDQKRQADKRKQEE